MDAIQLLKEDHHAVLNLLEQAVVTTTRSKKKREKLYSKIRDEIKQHTALEEEFLYPVLQESSYTRLLAFKARAAHQLVARLLEELDNLTVSDDYWGAKIALLQENVQTHIKEEERVIFKELKQLVGMPELREMARQMQEARASAKSQEGA